MTLFHSPLSHDLIAYWRSRQQGERIPRSEDFFDHVPPRLAPYLILYELVDHSMIVRFLGTQLVARWGEDLTGRDWLAYNPMLNAANITSNFRLLETQPCGAFAHSSFVTTVGRNLKIETCSLPLAIKPDRPARVISGSFALEAMGFNEQSRGWSPPNQLGWIDLGFGVPATAPKSPGDRRN
jgi:hypothetical protein